MKTTSNFRQRFSRFAALLRTALIGHPVELLILLHAAAAACVAAYPQSHAWMLPAPYAPFAAVASLCISFHRTRSKACTTAYWVLLPLYILTAFLPDAWASSVEIRYLYALLPALYLLARGVWSNTRFSQRFYSMMRSLLIALAVAALLAMLLMLILLSVDTLFGNSSHIVNHLYVICLILCFALVAPLVFIGLESQTAPPAATLLEEITVNYILTPALLLYNVVLYAYAATILLRWDLPQSSVASMVMAFVAVQVAIDIVRPLLSRQPLKWYFRWFGLIALPLVVLFWVATGYRLSQYGLTIDRCYLLLAGLLMTLYCLFTPFLRIRPWHWCTALLTAGVFILALGGPLSARQLSLRTQLHIIRANAAQAHLLTPQGTIDTVAFRPDPADTLYAPQHRAVYQAMCYIEHDLGDTLVLVRELGLDRADYLDRLSNRTARHAQAYRIDNDWYRYEEHYATQNFYLNNTSGNSDIDISSYNRMLLNHRYSSGESIPYPGGTINADTLLAAQLAKIGYTLRSNLDKEKLDKHKEQLLTYTSPDGSILIVFSRMEISKADSLNHLFTAHICYALSR